MEHLFFTLSTFPIRTLIILITVNLSSSDNSKLRVISKYDSDTYFVFSVCVCVFSFLLVFLWRKQWHPTQVFLPGESHGRRSLVGCSPWGRRLGHNWSDLAAAAAAAFLLLSLLKGGYDISGIPTEINRFLVSDLMLLWSGFRLCL